MQFRIKWPLPHRSLPKQVGDQEAKAIGQDVNQMATYIMECGGMERIEHLQMHDNNNIYNKVQGFCTGASGVTSQAAVQDVPCASSAVFLLSSERAGWLCADWCSDAQLTF